MRKLVTQKPAAPKRAVPGTADIRSYITPEGFKRFQDELDQLWRVDRPKIVNIVTWAAGNGDRSENGDYIYGKQKLREIDRRVRFLRKRLEDAEIVDSQQQKNRDQVFFGATVTYANMDDAEKTVRLVGVDEARQEYGEVSMVSPIARALLRLRVGDCVDVRTPNGDENVEVVKIVYPDA